MQKVLSDMFGAALILLAAVIVVGQGISERRKRADGLL
jgi:hypothetical protein